MNNLIESKPKQNKGGDGMHPAIQMQQYLVRKQFPTVLRNGMKGIQTLSSADRFGRLIDRKHVQMCKRF